MKDFYDPWYNKAKNDAKSLMFLRIAIVVAGLLPLVLALYAEKLLMIAFLGKALRATLAVLVLMAFYAPKFGTPRGAFVGVIVSVIAHTVYYHLIQKYEATLISPLTLMTPLATIGMGVLITKDYFDIRMAIGAALALLGVLIVAVRPNHVAPLILLFRNRSQ